MRKFPSTTELSSEQREIYSANLDKALLIVGPPGTGKTVMAIMRAQRMSQDGDCKIFMWNKTLEAYTKNQTNTHESLKKSVSTLEAHIKQKFKAMGEPLNIDYENFSFPWEDVYKKIDQRLDDHQLASLFTRQIIIDEAQDFPPMMFKALSLLWFRLKNLNITFAPSVMADENQRLERGANSSLIAIKDSLRTFPACYDAFAESKLERNYRNTKEIANVASKFYVGNKTGISDSIDCRSGTKPVLFWHEKRQNKLVERIIQYKINHPNNTVGVIFIQTSYVSRIQTLSKNLRENIEQKGLDIICQEYYNQDWADKKRNGTLAPLDFDSPNTITVIGKKSAKGLEFDCVFVPSVNDLLYSDQAFEFAMEFYVVLHRPRDHLFIGAIRDVSERDNNIHKIPSILKERLRTTDYKGDPITIGFEDEAEMRAYISVEDRKRVKEPVEKEALPKVGNIEIKPKIVMPKLLKTEKLGSYVRNRYDMISDFKCDKCKKTKTSKLIYIPDNKTESKICNACFGEISALKQNQVKKLEDKIKVFINSQPRIEENIKIFEDLIKLFPFGNQNQFRMQWQNIAKRSQIITTTPSPTTIPKPVKDRKNLKMELSIINGNQDAYLGKIIDIVKDYIVKKKKDYIQIISLKKDPSRVFKVVSRYLNNNREGITSYFVENGTDRTLTFSSGNKRKTIIISSPDEKINWNNRLIFLGLEDLREEELENDKIQDVMIDMALKSSDMINILHPNTAQQTPGIIYLNEKNDDDSLITKTYDY